MSGSFELSKDKTGKFRFNLLAINRRVILTSPAHGSREAALDGIGSVRQNAQLRERFEKRTSSGGNSYFVLLTQNDEIIGQGQMYAADSSCYAGIRSVMRNAATATLLDRTTK